MESMTITCVIIIRTSEKVIQNGTFLHNKFYDSVNEELLHSGTKLVLCNSPLDKSPKLIVSLNEDTVKPRLSGF